MEVGRLPTADGLSLLRNHRSFEDGTDEAAAAELIVQMTEGHAWSLDIIGAELKGRRYKTDRDFRDKCTELEALGCQQVIDSKTNSRYSRIAHGEVETSALLEPTFKLMVEHFGGEFLEIFKILGWFPVDEVSESILRQMVEEMLGSSLSASAWKNDFWMPLLDFSIVHESSPGFGCFHRLTHAVICKRFQRDEVWPYVFKVLKQVSVRMFKASEDKNDSLKGLNENLEIMFKILTCAHVGHEVEIADWEVERGGCLEAFREYLYVPRGIQDRVLDYAKGILKTLEKRQVGNVVNGKSLALARVHCYLSTVNYILGQYGKACQSAEDALRSFPRKDGDEVGDNDLIQCYEAAAEAYNSVGWRNQDVSFKRKGLYYATMASRLFPQNQHESTDYATCLSLVSVCHDAIGERDQALQMGREALAIRQKVLPPDSLELARSYNNLANTYVHFGEDVSCTEEERRRYFNLAIEHAEKALKLRINVTKENHPGVAWNLSCLSAAYLASGEFEERFGHSTESLSAFQKAFEYCRQALDMRVAIFSVMHPAVAKSCGRLVQICQHLPADDLHVKSERQRCAHYHHQIFDGYEKEIGRAKESGNDVRYEALKAELKRSQTYFPPI